MKSCGGRKREERIFGHRGIGVSTKGGREETSRKKEKREESEEMDLNILVRGNWPEVGGRCRDRRSESGKDS